MPKDPEQFFEIRKQTKKTIKEAALKILMKKGCHAASVSAISKEAGVSQGLMYNYFESKEDLIKSIVKEEFEESARRLKQVQEKKITPFQKLVEYTNLRLEIVESDIPYWSLFRSMYLNPAIKNTIIKEVFEESGIREHYFSSKSTLTGLFRELGFEDPEKEMMFYSVFMEGLISSRLVSDDYIDYICMKQLLINRYKDKESLKNFNKPELPNGNGKI